LKEIKFINVFEIDKFKVFFSAFKTLLDVISKMFNGELGEFQIYF